MPELPPVVYIEALERKIGGSVIEGIKLRSPSWRTVEPALLEAEGDRRFPPPRQAHRVGTEGRAAPGLSPDNRRSLSLEEGGRSQADPQDRPGGFHFASSTLILTEAGSKKRASLHVVEGEAALALHDPGGLEVMECDLAAFREVLQRENHILKRPLADPRLFGGIGNAYSDEILHAAQLSPVKWTSRFSEAELRACARRPRQLYCPGSSGCGRKREIPSPRR